ncbi:hypothetical protein TCON_2385 [Astathelohania contejeani]|uniref:Reverse transcriptase n=1 Tax=Astathelohania contejeani TaxID=164912 RepID=A0ABQ7HW60_9MICR|nr:hypothetical protein TCON_2385 [Thelohania contejeani]
MLRVDTKVRTEILVKNNRIDIFINDKRENEIILVVVSITSQDNLQIVETEKKRKYDLLTNELGLLYKAKTKIVPYVMTWDGVVTKYHRNYFKELNLNFLKNILDLLKKIIGTISLEYKRSIEDDMDVRDQIEESVKRFGEASVTGCQMRS